MLQDITETILKASDKAQTLSEGEEILANTTASLNDICLKKTPKKMHFCFNAESHYKGFIGIIKNRAKFFKSVRETFKHRKQI